MHTTSWLMCRKQGNTAMLALCLLLSAVPRLRKVPLQVICGLVLYSLPSPMAHRCEPGCISKVSFALMVMSEEK